MMCLLLFTFFLTGKMETAASLPEGIKTFFNTLVQHNRFLYLNGDLDPVAISYIDILYLYDKKRVYSVALYGQVTK